MAKIYVVIKIIYKLTKWYKYVQDHYEENLNTLLKDIKDHLKK